MLHILNGSSTEGTLRQSSIRGEFFSFQDTLIAGPAPAGLDESAWRRTRAAHLSQNYGVDIRECESDLLKQSEMLASSTNHDEVVLWFEHDLFCQLNLLYLLNCFSAFDLSHTKLSLVNIGAFPGRENFRGLGELNPTELASLFPKRQNVSVDELQLARVAWEAFCSPEPTTIESMLNTNTSALPFLSSAFVAHLHRFPTTRNGLGQIQNRSLELIDRGREKFVDLFVEFMNIEAVYGLGDVQVWLTLVGLASAKTPLLIRANGNGISQPTNDVAPKTVFKLSDAGKAVLRGEADFVKLNEIDEWLGGVHLQRNEVWRWDEETGRLKYC
jgi:hypothetical protein